MNKLLALSLISFSGILSAINEHEEMFINAVKINNISFVQECIKEGSVNLDIKDSYENSPLISAALNGCLEITEMLINNGANINMRSKYEFTPLMKAAFAGHASIVELLLKKGAIVDSHNRRQNLSALTLAIMICPMYRSVAQILIVLGGADVSFIRKPDLDSDFVTECVQEAVAARKFVIKWFLEESPEAKVLQDQFKIPLVQSTIIRDYMGVTAQQLCDFLLDKYLEDNRQVIGSPDLVSYAIEKMKAAQQ